MNFNLKWGCRSLPKFEAISKHKLLVILSITLVIASKLLVGHVITRLIDTVIHMEPNVDINGVFYEALIATS